MKSATAILYFTRSPEEELHKKSFHQKRSRAFQIAQFLVSRTRNVLHKTNLPVFEINSTQQVGNSPNERFDHAIKSIFAQGYENVIAVGNDCLQLTSKDIIDVVLRLQKKSLVLGPDLRGGSYLIGITKSSYRSEYILNAKWNHRDFLASFAANFECDDVDFLRPLMDINESVDQVSLRNIHFRKSLVLAFLRIFNPFVKITHTINLIFSWIKFSTISRAPPAQT